MRNSSRQWTILTKETTERDAGGEAGEEDEDEGGHALQVEGVPEVAEVVWVASSHVVVQTPEQAARPLQGVRGDLVLDLLLDQGCQKQHIVSCWYSLII